MMSIRICSLSSSVQDEHIRKTMLNSSHCSSSQEFEEVSKVLRTMAFIAETTTATRISQASRLPIHLVHASISRLNFNSVRNDRPSPIRLCRLGCARPGAAACPAASMKRQHHPSAVNRRQLEVC